MVCPLVQVEIGSIATALDMPLIDEEVVIYPEANAVIGEEGEAVEGGGEVDVAFPADGEIVGGDRRVWGAAAPIEIDRSVILRIRVGASASQRLLKYSPRQKSG